MGRRWPRWGTAWRLRERFHRRYLRSRGELRGDRRFDRASERFGRGLADPRLRAEIDVARDAGVARTCAPYQSGFSPPISFSALRQMIAAWHNVY
jgi:hypothetical protein